jgi:hypothetical protein
MEKHVLTMYRLSCIDYIFFAIQFSVLYVKLFLSLFLFLKTNLHR